MSMLLEETVIDKDAGNQEKGYGYFGEHNEDLMML
jgi:hypothetical protein